MSKANSFLWNERKYILLSTLYQAKRPMTSYELFIFTGVPLHSIQSALSNWVKWGYVARVGMIMDLYTYKLLPKGEKTIWWLSSRVNRDKLAVMANLRRSQVAPHMPYINLLASYGRPCYVREAALNRLLNSERGGISTNDEEKNI